MHRRRGHPHCSTEPRASAETFRHLARKHKADSYHRGWFHISYTTVGYRDVVVANPWRLMGGLEAMTGVLMFGRSTASLVTLLSRFRESREKA